MNDRGGPIYIGRFAPSPTGPLHAGSLVAALASWLDARAHGGRWLVRIEDVDPPRCVAGADREILSQLAACALIPDEPPVYQSARGALYARALHRLQQQAMAYPCGCTRLDIEREAAAQGRASQRHGELIYPGTCRDGLHGRTPRVWRFLTENRRLKAAAAPSSRATDAARSIADEQPAGDSVISHGIEAPALRLPDPGVATVWQDRALGPRQQVVASEVGDFVLRRADGLWAYQLAVVVDDAEQRITHVVRGEDLADNTARQILLQRALGLAAPLYLHTPLVRGANGEKLSKQNGAQPLDTSNPITALRDAGRVLRLAVDLLPAAGGPRSWLAAALPLWAARHVPADAADD